MEALDNIHRLDIIVCFNSDTTLALSYFIASSLNLRKWRRNRAPSWYDTISYGDEPEHFSYNLTFNDITHRQEIIPDVGTLSKYTLISALQNFFLILRIITIIAFCIIDDVIDYTVCSDFNLHSALA